MSVLHGVDVSRWQGAVNWARVAAAGYSFGFARATLGDAYRDPFGGADLVGMQEAGMLPGAYHVLTPMAAPEQQAEFFVNTVREALGGTAAVLLAADVETVGGAGDPTQQEAERFNFRVRQLTGRLEVDYIPEWWQHKVGWRSPGGAVPGWYWKSDYHQADLGPPTAPPSAPAGWPRVKLWQWTSTGRVDGIAGPVDLDVFFGDLGELRGIAGLATVMEDDVPLSDQALAQIREVMQEELREAVRLRYDAGADTIRGLLDRSPGMARDISQIRAAVTAGTPPVPAARRGLLGRRSRRLPRP